MMKARAKARKQFTTGLTAFHACVTRACTGAQGVIPNMPHRSTSWAITRPDMPDHMAQLLMVPGRVRVVDSCTIPSEKSQTAMASLFTHTAPQMPANDKAIRRVSQLPTPGQAGRCPATTELPRMSRFVTIHLRIYNLSLSSDSDLLSFMPFATNSVFLVWVVITALASPPSCRLLDPRHQSHPPPSPSSSPSPPLPPSKPYQPGPQCPPEPPSEPANTVKIPRPTPIESKIHHPNHTGFPETLITPKYTRSPPKMRISGISLPPF